ncbi:MAG: hypothetical protein DHS20C01_05920 [marine bacterium B5-7]|nr:MAG: hypothetical protein DHS20C01_05920 [marine bacterium B5-7]
MKDRKQQIQAMHAGFVNGVVEVCLGRRDRQELENVLAAAEANGWTDVVSATRKIVAGSRDASLLKGLDDEDATIVEAILNGLIDPASLPKRDQGVEAQNAAPGLASIIHAAASGDTDALQALAMMSEQMSAAGGDMATLAGLMRRILNGERNIDQLEEGLGLSARELLASVIDELNRLMPQ